MQNEGTERLKLLFSKADVAAALSLSPRTVDNLISRKQLTVVRVGRRALVHRSELQRLARQGA